MAIKQILFNTVASFNHRNKGRILEGLISGVESHAESTGLQVTFTGEYEQRLNSKSKVMPVPFVVIQNIDQYTDMPDGILSAVIYEKMRLANIVGSISPEKVRFDKKYEEISKEEKELLSRVRGLLFPEDKGKPLLNRNTIRHEGTSKDNGKSYAGTWRFDSKTADFETNGTFTLRRYSPKK